MGKLPKYTLTHNDKKSKWDLKEDKTGNTVESFDTKKEATTGSALSDAIGKGGGSVKIQKEDGKFQEERTYPGSADPSSSRG